MTSAAAPDAVAVTRTLEGEVREDRGRLWAALTGMARFSL